MGAERGHLPVKLVIPVLFSDPARLQQIRARLIELYGPLDYEAEPFLFTFTNFYSNEMEGDTFRTFYSFERLIAVDALVDVKLCTNRLEHEFAVNGKRRVNLDPGYLVMGKFVLATTKDHQHRLYIRDGIYEEITLFYQAGRWQGHPWTYRDYLSPEYHFILVAIRALYAAQTESMRLNRRG